MTVKGKSILVTGSTDGVTPMSPGASALMARACAR
jgi:hypothetical protein